MRYNVSTLKELISILEDKYPNRLPKSTKAIEDINILIGNQQVITFLKEILEKTEG